MLESQEKLSQSASWEPRSSLEAPLVKSSTARLLWHCFPSGEGAFWGCDGISWELKDISFSQLIVLGIDGDCRNEPQGWGGADSFCLHPPQEPKMSFRAGETCTPSHISPNACSPCTAPSNQSTDPRNGQEPGYIPSA